MSNDIQGSMLKIPQGVENDQDDWLIYPPKPQYVLEEQVNTMVKQHSSEEFFLRFTNGWTS